MDFSVIIVSWNVREALQKNLLALKNSRDVRLEIIVIDNNSADGSAQMVKDQFPEVRLIANKENVGFAKACNQGIRQAEGNYILLLNPDMEVLPWTLSRSLFWLQDNPQAAITGIHLVDHSGQTLPQVRRFPGVFDQSIVASKLAHIFPFLLHHYLCTTFNYEAASAVDSVRGSFFIIKRSTIEKIGLLDERYFVWFEEVDYCRQAREHGLEIWYTPAAEAIDYVGQSFKQVTRSQTQAYFKDSMLKYFAKWQPAWQRSILRLAWSIGGLIMKFFK